MIYEKAEKTEQDLEDEKLSAAFARGYVTALDDVRSKALEHKFQWSSGSWNDTVEMIDQMKSNLAERNDNGKI